MPADLQHDVPRRSAPPPSSEVARSARRSRFRTLVGAATLAVSALLIVAGVRAYGDLADARAREAELESALGEADARIEALNDRVERLRDDEEAFERVAREELGMVFPDEAVVLLPASESTPDDESAELTDGSDPATAP